MVEFRNRAEIETWLEGRQRADAIVLAARSALRTLPLLASGIAARGRNERGGVGDYAVTIVLPVFRGTATPWVVAKYSARGPGRTATSSASAYAFAAARVADASSVYGSALAASFAVNSAAYAANSAASAAYAATSSASASAASFAANSANYAATSSASASFAASAIDATALENGMLAAALADRPLWPSGAPLWVLKAWGDLKVYLLGRDEDWQIWTDWYEARHDGRRAPRQAIEIARVTLDETLWTAGPKAVNTEIRRLIEMDHPKRKPRERSEPPAGLGQRPSSHSFAWRGGKLEAIPVAEPPFDPLLAGAIAEALREKATELLAALAGNHADPIVSRDVQRALDLIGGPVDRIAEGILLMRANTVAAHTRAYADTANPRERAIRAALDDFSMSLGNLVDCYPGIRQINANRLELDVQTADAPAIAAQLDAIEDLARASLVVAASAADALAVGREELVELDEKIAQTDGQVRAAYQADRAAKVAARTLDSANFVSATAQKAEAHGGLKADTLSELRKTLPKPLARGIAKATEKTLVALPDAADLMLAYVVAGHWGAVAALVVRLAPHAHKIEQIARSIEKLMHRDDEDGDLGDPDA